MQMFLIFPLWLGLFAPGQGKGTITVTIQNIKEVKGHLMIGLFDNPDDFTVTPVLSFREAVTSTNPITVRFTDVPHKKYSVSVYHDLNDNEELDKNSLGIPKEPYGFSNNPFLMGPPTFNKCSFDFIETDLKLQIELR